MLHIVGRRRLAALCLLVLAAAAPAQSKPHAKPAAAAKAAPVMTEATMSQLMGFVHGNLSTGTVDARIAKAFGIDPGPGDLKAKLGESELAADGRSHYFGVPLDPASTDVFLLVKGPQGIEGYLTDRHMRLRAALVLFKGDLRIVPTDIAAGPFKAELSLFAREFADQLFLSKQVVPSQGLRGAAMNAAFRRRGITIVAPGDQPVAMMDSRYVYGGKAVGGARGNIVLLQTGGHPCQYVMEFDQPRASYSFSRSQLIAGPSGITHPVWTATAQDAYGRKLSSVGEEEIRSFSDVPTQRFHLAGPAIKRIVFWGDHRGFAAFCNAVIDDMVSGEAR
ncbi:MAG: hypothetical protein JWP49_4 [Phenylobacterium sp.]|jgi:hypothetical protein|nr:hypothetical protein [Phenylobacterium sp.]